MRNKISIGKQDFCSLREKRLFYVDKTYFIKEWWEADDDVTLITRPRRFGKTLNMSMLECFFSNRYEGRADLFEGLSIWEEEKYRKLLIPHQADNPQTPGFVIEFKVYHPGKEKDLEETVKNALKQIEKKQYDARLLCRGVKKENIRHYGFALEGKKVLIGE